jgi:hypothetical protein
MSGYPKTPPSTGSGALDGAIGQASTLGQLESLAGLTPETRIEFWLAFANVEDEAQRLATGVAELRRRIRHAGFLA